MDDSQMELAKRSPLSESRVKKPRLLFFRANHDRQPAFIRAQLSEQVKCLTAFFDVKVIIEGCNYSEVCEKFLPDLSLFESGVYSGPRDVTNTSAFPDIPKLGLLNADPFCITRGMFLSDMERWGIETYFTISVSMGEYFPAISDRLFVWPNFIDPEIFWDYGQPKIVPVLITGSQKMLYPWRNRINKLLSENFPSLICPHFGWGSDNTTSRIIHGREYAKMINASYVAPACGTIAKEIVRKHFEIPGCNSCLITEETPALKAAGFVDMQNCVFATEHDVLDKLEHLFTNRDVLESVSRAGHDLVHSQHTLRCRDQILQWFILHKARLPHHRIVQTGPFGSLAFEDERLGVRHSHCSSDCVDRTLVRAGYLLLRKGKYAEAERNFITCLNYWPNMPEPTLGLTLCNLYKGDARLALESIAPLITNAMQYNGAIDADPIEWTYFIISLLCEGKLSEATRRAHQFPFLHHHELERCRFIVDVLNGSLAGVSEQQDGEAETQSRPSVHQLPRRDLRIWINELCTMLKACHQVELAAKLQNLAVRSTTRAVASYDPSARRARRLTRGSRPGAILPLVPEPLIAKFRRHTPGRLLTELRTLVPEVLWSRLFVFAATKDEFALAIHTHAREVCGGSALVFGAFDSSHYTRVFLHGMLANRSTPMVSCLGVPDTGCKRLKSRLKNIDSIRFISGTVHDAKIAAGVECFDVVLFDRDLPRKEEALEAIRGADTVLISDVNTCLGHTIVLRLIERKYQLVGEKISAGKRHAIFRASNNGVDSCRVSGGQPPPCVA
jgi:hypothetical protein